MRKQTLKVAIFIMAILFIASLCTVMLAACNNKTENPSDQDAPPSEKEPYEFDYNFSHYKQVFFDEEGWTFPFYLNRDKAIQNAYPTSYTLSHDYKVSADETKIAFTWTFTPKATSEYTLRIYAGGLTHDRALQKVFVNGEEIQGQFEDHSRFNATFMLKYRQTHVITAYCDFRDEIFFKSIYTGEPEREYCDITWDIDPQMCTSTKEAEMVLDPHDYYVLFYAPEESYKIAKPGDLIVLSFVDDENADIESSHKLCFITASEPKNVGFALDVETLTFQRKEKNEYLVLIIHNSDSVPHKLQLKETVI